MPGTGTTAVPGNDGIQEHQPWTMAESRANDDNSAPGKNAMETPDMKNNKSNSNSSGCLEQHAQTGDNGLTMTATTLGRRETDSRGDEEEYRENKVGDLAFKDEKYKDSFLARLNTLRRNREMCDVVLLVGQREIHAHKAVLAAVSPTLFDLLSPNAIQQQTREESPTLFVPTAPALTNGHTQPPTVRLAQPNGFVAINSNDRNKNADQIALHVQGPPNGVSPSDTVSPTYLEFNDIDFDCFDALINYAYSGSLEINSKRVADLYKTASRLRMQLCAEACAKYLVKELSPQNCIGIRKSANRTNDFLLASKVDSYIQKNLTDITQKSKEFLALPVIQIEVVLSSDGKPEIAGSMKEERRLSEKVIDWLQHQVQELPEHAVFRMEMLTQKVHMLYLDEDMILQDCQDMDDSSTVGSSDMIQDYKKSSRRNVSQTGGVGSKIKNKVGCQVAASPGPKIARFSSTDSMNSLASDNEEVEWKIIAVTRTSENYYTSLSVIRRQLAALTIRLVDSAALVQDAAGVVDAEAVVACVPQTRNPDLAGMETPRCSVGAVCLNGKLIVCGGYDRGECLRSVEQYDPMTNRWTKLPAMFKERGRFDASVWDNKVYAVGGSDGTRDLQCAEHYDPSNGQWTKIAGMRNARSNHGVSTAAEFIYAIGGCQGQKPVKQCERYDPATNTWESIAPLQHARYQAGCCAWSEQVIAVSGCDTWNCINTVECYDPATNVWRFLPPLYTARRGCGVGVLKGKLYVFGGSDGVQSLNSVEVLDLQDPHSKWRPGPPLNALRGNVRGVVVSTPAMGEVLFAVGGFNGKSFLNSIEYLVEGGTEWKTTVLRDPSWPISFPLTALPTIAHLSLNKAKFVINEDPIGESQNEIPVVNGSASNNGADEGEVEKEQKVG